MKTVTIRLHKPAKGQVIRYAGELLAATAGYALVRAIWLGPLTDLGYVVFVPGDVFDEQFYADRYYAVFVLRDAAGALKGWYCNVSRPAQIGPDTIDSEDLELDLFVSPDRVTLLRLDEDEFAARELDAATRAAAWAALAELEALAAAGGGPFAVPSDMPQQGTSPQRNEETKDTKAG